MQKVILKKRLLGARKKDGPMQYLMIGTECWMDDNRAKYLEALGEVEKVDAKKPKPKPAAEPEPEPDPEGSDADGDDQPDL